MRGAQPGFHRLSSRSGYRLSHSHLLPCGALRDRWRWKGNMICTSPARNGYSTPSTTQTPLPSVHSAISSTAW